MWFDLEWLPPRTRYSGCEWPKDCKNMKNVAPINLTVRQHGRSTNHGSAPAKADRIQAHLHLVRSMARRIHARPVATGVELDDLVAYGAKGLVEAAARFDGRDVPFAVFARRRIQGAILDGIRAHHWFGRRADRRLRIDRVGHGWVVELIDGHQVHNDTRWNGRPMVPVPIETEDAIHGRIAIELRALPPRERRLLELCYYQGKTLGQAAMEMGICRPWASRLRARALAALRAAVEKHPSLPPLQHARKRSTLRSRHTEEAT